VKTIKIENKAPANVWPNVRQVGFAKR